MSTGSLPSLREEEPTPAAHAGRGAAGAALPTYSALDDAQASRKHLQALVGGPFQDRPLQEHPRQCALHAGTSSLPPVEAITTLGVRRLLI